MFHTITGAWTPACLLAQNLPVEAVTPPRKMLTRTFLFYRKSNLLAARSDGSLHGDRFEAIRS